MAMKKKSESRRRHFDDLQGGSDSDSEGVNNE